MSSKTKRILCLTMSLVLLLCLNLWSGVTVFADENMIQPRYSYTNHTTTSFSEGSGGTITCLATAEGYSGITTKVHIKMELQKFGMVKWETVTTWQSTFNNYYGILSKTYTLSKSGLYRVKATYTVYSGSAYETITSYSQEDFITV